MLPAGRGAGLNLLLLLLLASLGLEWPGQGGGREAGFTTPLPAWVQHQSKALPLPFSPQAALLAPPSYPSPLSQTQASFPSPLLPFRPYQKLYGRWQMDGG